MIEKFKTLSKGKKIIAGILGFLFLPIVLLALGVELLLKGIKTKKIGQILFGAFLAIIMIMPSLTITKVLIGSNKTPRSTAKSEVVETFNENNEDVTAEENIEKQEDEAVVEDDKEIAENKNPFGNVMEMPVMNGSKDKRIGTYAEVMTGGIEITQDNLIQFYNEVVKDSQYNWVTLNIDDKTGIQFSGSNSSFIYGTIDNEGCIKEIKGNGFISGDKIEYENIK